MSTRSRRMTGVMVALWFVLSSVVAGQATAQDATPMTEQPVTIGGSEITWSGDWSYMLGSSTNTSEQVTFSQTDLETQILKVLTFGVMPAAPGADTDAVIESFTESFLEGGVTDINEVTAGETGSGAVWKVYTMNPSEDDSIAQFNDGPLAALITASQVGDGGYRVTSLTVQAHLLQESITRAQSEFMLNGDGRFFDGIDAATATADLPTEETSVAGAEPEAIGGATPLASPEIIVATSAAATPVGSPEAALGATPDATPLSEAEASLAAVQNGATTPEVTPAP